MHAHIDTDPHRPKHSCLPTFTQFLGQYKELQLNIQENKIINTLVVKLQISIDSAIQKISNCNRKKCDITRTTDYGHPLAESWYTSIITA